MIVDLSVYAHHRRCVAAATAVAAVAAVVVVVADVVVLVVAAVVVVVAAVVVVVAAAIVVVATTAATAATPAIALPPPPLPLNIAISVVVAALVRRRAGPPPLLPSPLLSLRAPVVGGSADEFPANFFLSFFSFRPLISDSAKTSKKATDREQTKAPFLPIAIFTPRPPPPTYRSIHDQYLTKSPILATSRHNARRAQCRDIARIGTNVSPRAFFTCKNARGSIY